jgi:hypothetical protein
MRNQPRRKKRVDELLEEQLRIPESKDIQHQPKDYQYGSTGE